ncbi:MAG: hypothetical protein M1510_12755 [Nitrospirae bacterium]|nr:hypothetical protein [Nitrospirota bacterium]
MKGKQLLFVTYHDENFGEGLSYAVDLAKTMDDGIEILMIFKRRVFEKLEDMMTAIPYAEAGEHKTARELINEDYKKKDEDYESKLSEIKEKCNQSGVAVNISTAATDTVTAVKNMLRQNTKIDMVLLSPSVTNDNNITSKELNRLVKTASRPIVTMARNINAA